MLKEGTIIPIQSPYASPVVLCRKNNGLPPDNPEAYRFAVDYRKLNAITKYPRYPLPLIDDLIMNIPHTTMMPALYLRLGYFQLTVNPSDIVKTAFVTKNGTYAFRKGEHRSDTQNAVADILSRNPVESIIGEKVNCAPIRDLVREQLIEEQRKDPELGHIYIYLENPEYSSVNATVSVNKTTGKTPAELFLGRKLITPCQKLVMVSDGTEFAVGDIEILFDEARQNIKAKHEK
ncbi:retrovirus-related Pol polyprotein from transposon 17.6 [Trichonephila clavipes]|nr:retrovirus-related Pol polyprotein from transposon 17.6 [Trichonephila clavipes]